MSSIKMKIIYIQFLILFLLQLIVISKQKLHGEARLNITALANRNGYSIDVHEVVTQDGYILALYRIKGNRSSPILLMHGMIAASDVFIIRENDSLALTLAKSGYDVWIGNARGTPYSRRHLTLDPDNKRFWNYSFHEMGYYDLPAIIDYILKETGVGRLNTIGHSQGTTMFYVLGATRPEYNEKINVLGALAPVCFLRNLPVPWSIVVSLGSIINKILDALEIEEIFDYSLRSFVQNWCTENRLRAQICHELFFEFAGKDPEEFKEEFLPMVIGHFPTSTSKKNALHLLQNANSGKFSQFDYGIRGNLLKYGSVTPPEYDLSKVTMDMYIYAGRNDRLSSIKDVNTLVNKLSNVKEYMIMKRDEFNHIDHVWGRNMNKYLFPHLLKMLNKY